ncbi:MAG: DUF1207 domain-containing protein [Methyloglobulus sp.]|nr:DUF1207 domain-containing protein [Methyloglobulus sp.]
MIKIINFVFAIIMLQCGFVYAASNDDIFIAGYAAAVVKQNFKINMPGLTVKNGVVFIPPDNLQVDQQAKAVQLLSEVPGVNSVKFAAASAYQSDPILTQPLEVAPDEAVTTNQSVVLPVGFLPKGHLFKPLLADPRWAHFSASYRNYQTTNFDGRDIASVSFGETIPFYRANIENSTIQWESGIQGGVFSDFNLGASSADLLNSDFIASIYTSFRTGQFSGFGRIYHQSSHLGDEFLIRQSNTKFERVNLSYEGVDLRLSYELPYGVRIYGGGGGLFHKEPSNLKPWSTQYGVEFRSPWYFEFASMRPIIAADFKNFEENNWNTDISARAGVEFNNLSVLDRKLQILVEYFNGYTPSGQFYKNKVEYIGLGAHFHF